MKLRRVNWACGGIGIRVRLRSVWSDPWEFESPHAHRWTFVLERYTKGMERFPSSGSPENKKTKGLSGVGKLARATLAGIAGLGAVAATEIPLVKEAIVPTAEAHESFDAAQEAEAFLDTIEDEDVGIDDARGRHRMRVIIWRQRHP